MRFSTADVECLTGCRRRPPAVAVSLRGVRGVALWLGVIALAGLPAAPPALAEEQATPIPRGTLVKVVILSRHGVRSPIPKQSELDTWTESQWPIWRCPTKDEPNKVCDPGQLTPRGASLAQQMGIYYQTYSFAHDLISIESCPAKDDLFFWADTDERTVDTGRALLQGLVPRCDISPYLHEASSPPDRVFHPVTSNGACKLDPDRAEKDILQQAGGSLARFNARIRQPLDTAQRTLQCCRKSLCEIWWDACRLQPPPPAACTLVHNYTACLVRRPDRAAPTRVELGGSLRVASLLAAKRP
jgi:4-phytase / acid phosphatase